MAVHGADILERVQQVESLPEALQGCQRAIATTARSRSLPTKLETPRDALEWLIAPNSTSALIFGPEDRGLSNLELSYAQRFVAIPANREYPSLNLAQAVAVCAYEFYQGVQAPETLVTTSAETTNNLATLDALEGYYQQLEATLLKIGYLYPHTAASRMEKIATLV